MPDAPVTMLTVEQLAARWNVNAKTIYSEINNGKIRALRLGRILRVPLEVVKALETQGRVLPTEES